MPLNRSRARPARARPGTSITYDHKGASNSSRPSFLCENPLNSRLAGVREQDDSWGRYVNGSTPETTMCECGYIAGNYNINNRIAESTHMSKYLLTTTVAPDVAFATC